MCTIEWAMTIGVCQGWNEGKGLYMKHQGLWDTLRKSECEIIYSPTKSSAMKNFKHIMNEEFQTHTACKWFRWQPFPELPNWIRFKGVPGEESYLSLFRNEQLISPMFWWRKELFTRSPPLSVEFPFLCFKVGWFISISVLELLFYTQEPNYKYYKSKPKIHKHRIRKAVNNTDIISNLYVLPPR